MGEAAVELAAGTGSDVFETFETPAGEVSVEEVLVGSALPPAMPRHGRRSRPISLALQRSA